MNVSFIQKHWGKFLLIFILLIIIMFNFRPGFFILGNDNYSPEVNPTLSLERSIFNPAWRAYRMLGIPSDSEQADIFRSALFYMLQFVFPAWFTSQLYVFGAFFVASLSTAFLARDLFRKHHDASQREIIFVMAGLFYVTTLLTSWIFLSPLKVFLAGYAFLPLLLWRTYCAFGHMSLRNILWLLVSLLFFTTSSMVATTFIVESGVILLFLIYFFVTGIKKYGKRYVIATSCLLLFIIFGSQLFWILPFTQYVKTNSKALQESYINRVLTPQLIEGEVKYNTPQNISRFYGSWVETKNEDGTHQFVPAAWYSSSKISLLFSFFPTYIALFGFWYCFRKRIFAGIFLGILGFLGWMLIKGINPPFEFLFVFLQKTIPLFKQVFRWQSSKVFPLLIIPMSLLGALGVVFITNHFRNIQKKMHIMGGIVVCLLVVVQLLYVYPFFTGQMIDKSNFVAIPDEYYDLLSYLKTNNLEKQRIYLAPEANTLYFRNYSWGFFGSSLLNYLLPNPLIEKALVTGSHENEQAQNVLEDAYNSKNFHNFTTALLLYDTPLVLLDTSANRNHNGYKYDDDIGITVVKNNPRLQKIWTKGKLSLYQVISEAHSKVAETLYFDHNFEKVNTLRVSLNQFTPYITNKLISGTIYPLGLNFQTMKREDNTLTLTHTYQGLPETYVIALDERNIATMPTKIDLTTTGLQISGVYPEFFVNEHGYTIYSPIYNGTFFKNPLFVSLGNDVFSFQDLQKHSIYSSTHFSRALTTIKAWTDNPEIISLGSIYKEKFSVPIKKNTIMEVKATIFSNQEMPFSICAFSQKQLKCLNRTNVIYLSKIPETYTLLLPEVILAGDTIDIYLQSKTPNNQGIVALNSLEVKKYTTAETIDFNLSSKALNQENINIPVQKGDQLRVKIPLFESQNAYALNTKSPFLPDVTHGDCQEITRERFLKTNYQDYFSFMSHDCFDQLITKFERINSTGVALMYYAGNNLNGIPLFIHLRETKSRYQNYDDIFAYEGKTQKYALFQIPSETRSYDLEIYGYGTGTRTSKNQLTDLVFQIIPPSWFSMMWKPKTETQISLSELSDKSETDQATYEMSLDKNAVVTIPQAIHPNWEISSRDKNAQFIPIIKNGWQQGWISQSSEDVKVHFWPNTLVLIGGTIYIVGLVGVVFITQKSSLFKH